MREIYIYSQKTCVNVLNLSSNKENVNINKRKINEISGKWRFPLVLPSVKQLGRIFRNAK